jgi:phage tail P2-like protein
VNLTDVKTIELVPVFMQEEPDVVALAEAWDALVMDFAARSRALSTWDSIGALSEAELDELAYELRIPWYKTDATLEQKREVIRTADMLLRKIGTKYAVETIASIYYGAVVVNEWFEYGGDPFHFRISTTNKDVQTTKQAEFLRVLGLIKRKTAVLDAIILGLECDMPAACGFGYSESAVCSAAYA